MIIHWTNGSAPYQVQMQTNLMALWENVGGQTTLCCTTNSLQGGMGFFRVICGTNPPPPMVIIAAAQPNASMAGPTNGVFTVARAGSTDAAVTVPYTITGTASNGVDYAWLSGSVTLGVGVASASIVVAPTAITLTKPSQTVTLAIRPPAGFMLGPSSNATVRIANTNDLSNLPPTVMVVATRPNASKAGPINGQFVVARAGSIDTAITVPYTLTGTASNGVDYVALPGSVTLGAGARSANIIVAPIPDTLVRPTLKVTLAISAPPGVQLDTRSSANVFIMNTNVPPPPPPPTLSIAATQPNASKAGPTNGIFTVSRTGSTATALTVPYTITGSAANGVDYTSLPGSVTLGAGAASAQIVVTPIPDTIVQPTLTVTLAISAPAGALLGAPSSATVSIANTNIPPPPATLSIVATQPNASKAGPINGIFTVSRVGSTTSALTVPYTIAGTANNGVDYVALLGSVTLAAGATSVNIVLTPIPDMLVNPTLTAIVTITAPAGAVIGGPSSATVSIANTNVPLPAPPGPPQLFGTCPALNAVNDVWVSGNYAYVAEGNVGLCVVDVSNPGAPRMIASNDKPFHGQNLVVSGTTAFVTGTRRSYSSSGVLRFVYGFYVIDIAIPTRPLLLGTLESETITFYGLDLSGSHAFVACGQSGVKVVDVSNPAQPTIVGSYQTPGLSGSVAVSGHYAYVADGTGGLQILDVSNPAAPLRVGYRSTPDYAGDIAVSGSMALVADVSSIQVVDVTNPSDPIIVGAFATSAGRIRVQNQLAYVAEGSSGFNILDVSNPSSPRSVGSLAPPGPPNAITSSVFVHGQRAYMANCAGGLAIVNVSNAAAPTLSATVCEWFSGYKMAMKPGLAVVTGTFMRNGGAQQSYGIQVLDTSNPTRPRLVGSLETNAYGFYGIAISGTYAFAACGPAGVKVIDFSNPAAPSNVATAVTLGSATSLMIQGNYLYIANGYQGLRIIEISNPRIPVSVGLVDMPGNTAKEVCVVGNLAYLVCNTALKIIDVSSPANPTIIGSYPIGAADVKVQNGVAYLAAGMAGLVTLDVSDPSNLRLIGTVDRSSGSSTGVYVSGSRAYLANALGGLEIVDVSHPATPLMRNVVLTLGFSTAAMFDNGWICLSDGLGSLNIISPGTE